MEKDTIDKVLFELDNIMYGDGYKVLTAHTSLADGTLLLGRRYQSPLNVSWYVRPCPPEDNTWEVAIYPPMSRHWSKKVELVEIKEHTATRVLARLLRAMCRLAEEVATEV